MKISRQPMAPGWDAAIEYSTRLQVSYHSVQENSWPQDNADRMRVETGASRTRTVPRSCSTVALTPRVNRDRLVHRPERQTCIAVELLTLGAFWSVCSIESVLSS